MFDTPPLKVKTPGRYLGTEVNLPRKHLHAGMLHCALAFPDVYEVAMSHIGLKILYHILNERDDILCERVFAPWTDMMRLMRTRNIPLTSLETHTPLHAFHMVGFSLQYEMSYPTLLAMLERGGIPLKSSDRTEGDPFILAGGPCAVNPEPLASFVDAFAIGDGEQAILEIADCLKQARENHLNRKDTLETLAKIKGIYVPAFLEVSYDYNGRPTQWRPLKGRFPIHRRIEGDLNSLPFPAREVVPIIRPVHDRYAVEIARGCLQGCRFCQAGFIYRPYRERDQEKILSLLREGLRETGYDECSFLSLSAGDYSHVSSLLETAVSHNRADRVSISLPSLRISSLTPEMIQHIKSIRKTGFTVAPEAGTQRLRDVINKKIDEDEIFSTLETIFQAGWHLVKLYFMIGLPTEQWEDVEGIVTLVTKAWRMARKISRKNEVTASISTFVPKPHTPFQWCAMAPLEEILKKQQMLRQRLNRRGMRVKWHLARLSVWEGVLARGGRPAGAFLERLAAKGAYLDGWTDQFNADLWETALEECGQKILRAGLGPWSRDALLPWDVIDTGVRKEYLWEEYQHAISATLTPPCPRGSCRRCGVCNATDMITVRLSDPPKTQPAPKEHGPMGEEIQAYLHVTFIKIGKARFLGHLDTARAILMAARRAGLPMAYSGGFHPAPRVRFSPPIPLGMESLGESVEFSLTRMVSPKTLKATMNAALPPGLRLTRVRCATLKSLEGFVTFSSYLYVCLFRTVETEEVMRIRAVAERIQRNEADAMRISTKNGPVEIQPSECLWIDTVRQTPCWLRVHVRIGRLPRGIRPFTLMADLFGMTGEEEHDMRMIKIRGSNLPGPECRSL